MKHILKVTALGLVLSSSGAYANHIDFLDGGAFELNATGGEDAVQQNVQNDPASTLGGERQVRLSVDAPASNTATASLNANGGGLNYTTSDSGMLFLGVGYGDSGDLNANFLDIPDMAADWDRARLDFGPDSAAADVRVDLFSRENGGLLSSTMSFAGGAGSLDFLYSDLGASDDFLRNVDQAAFQINAPGAGDYTVSGFTRNGFVPENANAVPAPGGLGLLGLGLALLGFAKFRRNTMG